VIRARKFLNSLPSVFYWNGICNHMYGATTTTRKNRQMMISRRLLGTFFIGTAAALSTSSAQIAVPRTAATSGREISVDDSATKSTEPPLTLHADLGARIITAMSGDTKIKTYQVAVGQDRYPTPTGTFHIEKIVWNPSWTPPPDAKWARGKSAKGPGDPGNPMKVVKIFFHDPDYYIHGTDDVDSLGDAASHGCLRMAPDDVADLAKLVMEKGGQPHDENWFWRIIHFRRQEKVVYLDNPIELTITD
jgi:lipoprotein-anchoring transpeptidase ErfK/SrfK